MICYHTGTGNTRACARLLSQELGGERLHRITSRPLPELASGERLILMFPIYSWGVPPVMTGFVKSLGGETLKGREIWAICTCGDEAGVAMRRISAQIAAMRGEKPQGLWSVQMPNDYVLLPGFTVDPKDVADAKLRAMAAKIKDIARTIKSGKRGVYDVVEGSLPRLRSMVFPLFEHWGVNPAKWHVDSGKCISCGKCAKACPVANITLRQGLPTWGGNCLSCCACFHVCPERAIDYGIFTRGKGQYYLPDK